MTQPAKKYRTIVSIAIASTLLVTLTLLTSAWAFPTPACPGAPGSVAQGHNHTFMQHTCSPALNCVSHTQQCNQNPCSRCSGFNYISFCQSSADPDVGNCTEIETGCGLCYVNGMCDPMSGTCSGGAKRDADNDGYDDICYVRKCR